MEKPLDHFFSDVRIVRYLCKRRLKQTLQNRRNLFLAGIANARERKREDVARLLPSRQYWPRAGKARRHAADDPLDARAELLSRYVLHLLSSASHQYGWLRRLRLFIAAVRAKALNWSDGTKYQPARVSGIPKGHGREGYRLLALYDLENSVIASGFASYLRECLEPSLGDECLAFRAASSNGRPTHHDAVARIAAFAGSAGSQRPLWAAECDIVGFFDAVDHGVAREAVLRCIPNVEAAALRFIESFFAGYCYSGATEIAAKDLRRQGVVEPKFKNMDEVRRSQELVSVSRYGIPQGSAVSCILANIVLASADRACLAADGSGGGLYVRYCDDIVIVHPDNESCAAMLQAYQSELKRLLLPAHEAQPIEAYSRKFWDAKSKLPYRWSNDVENGGMPWLAFVGYHLRRDGALRARPASIAKELAKQRGAVDKIISRVCSNAARAHPRRLALRPLGSVLYRLRLHLLAFSVGYPAPNRPRPIEDALCWSNGFVLLRAPGTMLGGLRNLDRGRDAAIGRLAGRLRGLEKSKLIFFRNVKTKKKTPFALRYGGWPFAYFAQFAHAVLPPAVALPSLGADEEPQHASHAVELEAPKGGGLA